MPKAINYIKQEEDKKIILIEALLSRDGMGRRNLNIAHSTYMKYAHIKNHIRDSYKDEMRETFIILKKTKKDNIGIDYIEDNGFNSEAVRWSHAFIYLMDLKFMKLNEINKAKLFSIVSDIMPKTKKEDNLSKDTIFKEGFKGKKRSKKSSCSIKPRPKLNFNNPIEDTDIFQGGVKEIPQMII